MNHKNLPIGSITKLAVFALLGLSIPASAGVVFFENFEAPAVNGFDDDTVPGNGKWIGANLGFGASNRGHYNETFSWPATAAFTTPYGYQAYYLNYSNSGLTTSVGATGQTLATDISYKVSFNAAVTSGTASGSFQVELVAFTSSNDNASRGDCQATRPGTILATATGTVTSNDMSAAHSLTFTANAANAHLGKDLGIRLIKASNNVLYDNIRLVTGHDMLPSPASGVFLPAGNTVLSWTNMPPTLPATNTYVDVWFGTNPAALTQVEDGALTSTTNVNAPSAGTYYWRVDSYPDGNPNGTPISGDLFFFEVADSDSDGLPDAYEQANTTPSSPTALVPSSDLDTDGLTAAQEYYYGTNPNDNDTDNDTLLDGPELTGVSLRPATSPVDADSDDDGLSDGVETNTGTWVGAANTGTNPADADWDNDGIKDGGETNTAIYVDRFNTGSNPFLADSDSDGALDWYEANASFTNPNSNTQTPTVPYPLPDPVSTDLGATNKPVKVYIMAGQSNTVGIGQVNGTALGTLETITKRENKFPNLIDGSNNWTKRNDVIYKGVVTATAAGPLTAGQGASNTQLGPELGFGQIMGWHHDEPVLILKASQGNRSLGWDFQPPGGTDWVVADKTYPGYGRSPSSWLTASGGPAPGGWYAGKQYDDCFRAEANMGMIAWASGTAYASGVYVRNNGAVYTSKSAHTADASSAPGTGASWATYWNVYTTVNAHDVLGTGVLQNLSTTGNNLNGRTYQIAGFCWWQGHKDHTDGIYAPRYEQNLVQLINALRADFNAPNAPVVVATIGFGGGDIASKQTNYQLVHGAQMAVGNPALYPAFDGNVKSVDILKYWREVAESPKNQDYHYNQSAETYMLVGDAMGRAMLEMQDDTSPPSPDPMTFAVAPTAVVSGTIGMVATTATDFSGPVQYLFDETSGNAGSTDSAWQTSPTYQNSGLTNGLTYTYRVKTRDALEMEGGWSAEISAIAGSDSTAPAPAPSFATPPATQGETSISMTATTATDINGVEYYFDCTVGGGTDSAWQSGTQFIATGLTPATAYTYVVRARDSIGNITTDSASASATTLAPDTSPPSPATMSFTTPPTAQGTSSITMTAAAALDPSGVEYFFDETSGNSGSSDSGWQDSPTYIDSDLQPGTQYTYQVRARDKSPAQTTNNFSPQASATTELPDTTPPTVINYNPAPAAVDITPSANLVLTFDEEIVPGTGLITIKNLTDATETTLDVTNSSQVTAAGSVLTINPTANLGNAKNYAIQIAPTAIKDLEDNFFTGINNDTTWTFTSAVLPFVWTQNAGGARNWTDGTNWQGGSAPSPVSGDTIDFSTVNIGADTTLTLGADRSARLWRFGDTGSTQNWIVSAGNQIILAGITPTIEVKQNTTTLQNAVTGTSGLRKTGAGILVLTNTSNSYTGGTFINAGTLQPSAAALGTSANTITFTANGELRPVYSSNPIFTQSIVINPGATAHLNAVNQFYSHTVSGIVSGTGTLLISGTDNSNGSSTLSNISNSHTGIVRVGNAAISGNLFTANIADSIGAGAIQFGGTSGSGNLTFSGTSTPQSFTNRVFTLSGTTGGGSITNNGATANIVTISQNLAITSNGTKTLTLSGTNTGANAFSGTIGNSGSGATSITKAGAGYWTLSGNNSYNGATTLTGGTLSIGSIGNINGGNTNLGNPSSAANGKVLMGSGNTTATLLYTGVGHSTDRTIQIGDTTAANTGGGVITNNGTGPLTFTAANFNSAITGITATRTLTIGGSYSANPNQIQSIIQDNSATGKVAVTKANDASTWIISGANTYTGATTVSGGKLLVNSPGSLASGSAVAVNGSSTLGGNGTIGGTVTVAATASLAPGASAGTLAIGGGLNLSAPANNGAGKLAFELGAIGASDQITVGGALTIGTAYLGFSDFIFSPLAGLQNGTYTLITYNTLSGTLATSGLSGAIGTGGTGTLQLNTVSKTLELVVSGLVSTNPYETWAIGGVAFDADTNNDGVDNGMAWLLGAANPSENALGKLPAASRNGANLRLTFRCLKSTGRGGVALKVQSSNDLGVSDPWTSHEAAVPDADSTVNGVIFNTTDDIDPAFINVIADIPASGAKLFGRIVATK